MTTAGSLTVLGTRLRAAGLTEQALLAWAGTHRISWLPLRMSALVARPIVPAATALALFVAGAELAIERLRALPLDALLAAELVERIGDRVRATVAVIPHGPALLVCDRLDAEDDPQRVCWPDDSSYHLASAIDAGRRPRWLDLACGSAFAPLARPDLGAKIVGVDLNPRAVRYARLGVALTGSAHVEIVEADIGARHEPAAVVTCNAPIPDDPDVAIWRHADRGFFDRMWPAARACVAPGGEVIVHSTLAAVAAEVPGERISVAYTPPGERAYAITWWRPEGPARAIVASRALTTIRPHLTPRDRDDARAGALPRLAPPW